MTYTIVDTKDNIVTSETLTIDNDTHTNYNLYTYENLTEDQLMSRILDAHKYVEQVCGASVLEASLLSPKTFGTNFHPSNIMVKDDCSVHTLVGELDALAWAHLTQCTYNGIPLTDVSLLVAASYIYARALVTDNTHDDRAGFFDLIEQLSAHRYFTCIGEADWNTAHMTALFKLLCQEEAYVALSSFAEWQKFYNKHIAVTQTPMQFVPRKYWEKDSITDHSITRVFGTVPNFEDSI